jgi:acyl-CoA reductase-like NAD-dependent aldehyde dehydrogenase
MKLYFKGAWRGGDELIEVINPFDGQIVDTVPRATAQDVEEAIESAQRGAEDMKSLTGYERFEILSRATALIRQRADEIARTLSLEEGKPLAEALFEVDRSAQNLELSGE